MGHRGMAGRGKSVEKVAAYHGHKLECVSCGCVTREKLSVDHIVPRSKGGSSNFWNLVVTCQNCNRKKGSENPLTTFAHVNRKVKRVVDFAVTVHKEIQENFDTYVYIDALGGKVIRQSLVELFKQQWSSNRAASVKPL